MVGLPGSNPYGTQPKKGLLGFNDHMAGLSTNPLFNFGMGMLGSQSPHLSNALAAGGQQMQQGSMLKSKMTDQAANRKYREEMLNLARDKARAGSNASTNAIRNAQFMFPNDPIKQREYIEGVNQSVIPADVQKYNFLKGLPPTEQDEFMKMLRASKITDLGGGKSLVDPTGQVTPLSTLDEEAAAKEALAAASTRGQEKSKLSVEAQADLPQAEIKASEAIKLMDDVLAHPGLGAVVGVPNPLEGGFGSLGNIPGSSAADFQTYLDQIGGQVFLEAYQGLKGGGQITEVEGDQAKKALARMGTAQSEESFKAAVEEYKGIIMRGLDRARTKAGVDQQPPTQPSPSIDPDEGKIARNQLTGETMIKRNGKWVKQ